MYIDPGAGSILLQVIGAGVVAVAATFSQVRRSVSSIWHRWRGK
ncbi:MAG TPA: hypothetical protein VKA84_23180 [Gemmatimonadaceae bacterium]|nr:hypothetical protein [Gemmatimonadaceae bacterium]